MSFSYTLTSPQTILVFDDPLAKRLYVDGDITVDINSGDLASVDFEALTTSSNVWRPWHARTMGSYIQSFSLSNSGQNLFDGLLMGVTDLRAQVAGSFNSITIQGSTTVSFPPTVKKSPNLAIVPENMFPINSFFVTSQNRRLSNRTWNTVWPISNLQSRYTFPSEPIVLTAKSSSSFDEPGKKGAHVLRLYFLDRDGGEGFEDLTLGGKTGVAMKSLVHRINFGMIISSGSEGINMGNISLAASGKTYLYIPAEAGVSTAPVWTVPTGRTLYIAPSFSTSSRCEIGLDITTPCACKRRIDLGFVNAGSRNKDSVFGFIAGTDIEFIARQRYRDVYLTVTCTYS